MGQSLLNILQTHAIGHHMHLAVLQAKQTLRKIATLVRVSHHAIGQVPGQPVWPNLRRP